MILGAPEVAARTEGKILLDVFVDGKAYDTDRFDVQIFPRYAKPDYTYAEPAGLYDPAGKTEALLKKAGFPYRRIATAEEAEAYRLIRVRIADNFRRTRIRGPAPVPEIRILQSLNIRACRPADERFTRTR